MQVMVIPISEASRDYAAQVREVLRAEKFYVDVDNADKKMQKKIREAQLDQYNYILVMPSSPNVALSAPVIICPCSLHTSICPLSVSYVLISTFHFGHQGRFFTL